MGNFFSGTKTCSIEAPKFKDITKKLLSITRIIEKLSLTLSKPSPNPSSRFDPILDTQDLYFRLLATDNAIENVATRYNAYAGFYSQMAEQQRSSSGERILRELMDVRNNMTSDLSSLCK